MGFPIYVNIYKKDVMDSHRSPELNVKIPVGKDVELEEGGQQKDTAATVETVVYKTWPNT